VRNVFDDYVPFEFAARLRVGAEQHPGLEVHPSIQRVVGPQHDTALNVLIGSVANMDRAQPDPKWVDRFLAREMPPDWLDEFAPEAMAATGADRERLQQEARERYEYALLRRERRGTSGCEYAFDDTLMGRLGMRLVEHDSRHREQLLWSHLRVEAGADLRITIDQDLQQIAERLVADAQARNEALHEHDADRRKVEAALAVVDALSGDVLVYAGAPIVSRSVRDVPGVFWRGNGSLGSVVKPLMLVEQLEREALGLPHKELASFAPCAGKYVFGNRSFGCGHAHGERGRDPVDAIAESCNSFFFQCAEGFGADGVAHALRRFGLLAPTSADDPFADCWQAEVPGIRIGVPRWDDGRPVPMRAIGYGVAASPLSVARAYCALATGGLPTLGLRAGEARRRIELLGLATELDIVRAGLRACVDTGTAKNLPQLRQFGVMGKTGTAEVGPQGQNNAWFAGYLPTVGPDGAQLCVCAVVYWVKDKVHGDEAAGDLVAQWLAEVAATPALAARYLPPLEPEGGR
jgi:penicillin-binding protein 2